MPINRRLPKRGFTNIFKKVYQLVNLDQLNRFEEGSTVDASVLAGAGLVKYLDRPIKLLGRGDLEAKSLQVKVNKASQSAVSAVEGAGGNVTVEG